MYPVLLFGAVLLVSYLFEGKSAALRDEAQRERRRLKSLKARRSRIVSEGRRHAIGLAIAAAKKMIAVVKRERRAAAEAQDRLRWGSEGRDRAHALVSELSGRLGRLYETRKKLYDRLAR